MDLILKTPSSFEHLVKKELKNAQLLVVVELFDRLERKFKHINLRDISGYDEKWHKNNPRHDYLFAPNGCGCELCSMFREYAQARINAHRLGRLIERYCSVYPVVALQDEIKGEADLQRKLSTLKARKKEILLELGLMRKGKAYIPIEQA